jgi:anthranilate synthase/aminodeoxychorismate synthase-like glutamine amidotransferase
VQKTVQKKILLIDNYDSFTYNLSDYVQQCGAICHVVRNDDAQLSLILEEKDTALRNKWNGILFSPGPKTPQEAGLLAQAVAFFIQKKIPVFGVCLGFQAIGEYFGASLIRAPKPRHGKTSRIIHTQTGLFEHIKQPTEVMRYHSLILENLENTPLLVTARSTDDHCIMAFRHNSLPVLGVQFHPESILTSEGLTMIRNWLLQI